jgi:hypothetical protein
LHGCTRAPTSYQEGRAEEERIVGAVAREYERRAGRLGIEAYEEPGS